LASVAELGEHAYSFGSVGAQGFFIVRPSKKSGVGDVDNTLARERARAAPATSWDAQDET